MPAPLSRQAKQELFRESADTWTSSGQSDGSQLMKLMARNDDKSPMRIADKLFPKPPSPPGQMFSEEPEEPGIGDFFQTQQEFTENIAGKKLVHKLPDGLFVQYVKEKILQAIDNGAVQTPDQSALMINQIANEYIEHLKKIKETNPSMSTQAVVKAETERLTAEVGQMKEQRIIRETQQLQSEVADLKAAVDEIKKSSKSFFTPTGIKLMQAAIKEFDKLPNPTNEQRLNLISKIKDIATHRVSEQQDKRGALLHDFYVKVSHKDTQISKKDINHSKLTTSSILRIREIFKDAPPDSTFAKIDAVMKRHISAEAKLTKMQEILEQRLAEKSPDRQLKGDFINLYRALINYADEVKSGKNPNVEKPKLAAIGNKLNELKLATIASTFGIDSGEPKPTSPRKGR